MATTKIGLGLKGLNADTSPFSLSPEYWNKGLNLRPKDSSVQAVPKSTALTIQPLVTTNSINPISICQYIPDGATYLNNIVLGLKSDNTLAIRFTSNASATTPSPQVAELTFPAGITATYNTQYGIDNFNFNGLSIINTKTSIPAYYNANVAGTTYTILPDWITTTRNNALVAGGQVICISSTATTVTFNADVRTYFQVNDYISPSNGEDGAPLIRVTAIDSSGTVVTIESNTKSATAFWFVSNSPLYYAYPFYARGLSQFQGRLVAWNLYLDRPGTNKDVYSPIQFAWSQPITNLQSLTNVGWSLSATNSAGFDYITETPGEVLAAEQLNEYLVVYKSDSVYVYQDTGAPFYLVAKQLYKDDGIFNTKTVVAINSQQHFVVGNKGIYIHQAGVEKKNLSRGRIEEAFYRGIDGVDYNYRGIAFCYHNILEKEVWVCYRSANAVTPALTSGGVIGCDRAYCYNYLTDTWYQRSLDNVTQIRDEDIGNTSFTVIAQPSQSFVSAPTMLNYFPIVTMTAVGIYEPINYMQFDDRDITTASIVKNFSAVYPHTDNPIKYQLKLTNTHDFVDWSTIAQRYFNPDLGQYRLDYRETGRFAHMRVSAAGTDSITATITNPYFSNLDINVEQRGRR